VALHFVTAAGWIVPALPWNTQPWIWAALFALGWAGVGWRSGRARSRVLAGAAVPVSILMALVLFKAYFYYLPTFGDVLGKAPADRASAAQVESATNWVQQFHRIGAVATTDRNSATDPMPPRRWSEAMRASPHGLVLPEVFPATRSHFAARPGWVYLPPAWWGPERSRLPVLELFGGTPSSPLEWLRGADVQGAADAFAAAHGGMAPVLAMVDDNGSFTGDTECVDRPGVLAETYAVTDIRDDMVQRFGVTENPHAWGVAGVSEGGLCALAIGLRHSGDFSLIGDFGGEPVQSIGDPQKTLMQLFGGNAALQASYDPDDLMRGRPHPGMAAMFVSGRQDPNLGALQAQSAEARADDLRVAMRVVPGGHTYRVWREAARQFIPFAWQALASPGDTSASWSLAARTAHTKPTITRSR
jgi:S-formylglutathione hydrolase FrmB